MKLVIFQANKGDCLLLTGEGGANLLIDGGLKGSYKDHVAPHLGRMARRGQALDLVYLSHIDQDHIGGILQLMDDVADWRVYEFQSGSGNTRFPRPKNPRPPLIHAVWHNAFKDQVGENSDAIEDQLVANSKVLHMNQALIGGDLTEQAESCASLVTSIQEGVTLARRIGRGQLDLPINEEFDGKLIVVDREGGPPASVNLGNMKVTVIGPFLEDLEKLRTQWNNWLKTNQEILRDVRESAERDAASLPLDEGQLVLSFSLALAAALGDRDAVTTPNLASLMLLIEENGNSILLTGDGHADDILRGLELHRRLDDEGRLHVGVLKVQHHGSENNIHRAFCEAITADHYVFCGNGAHENPNLDAIQAILDSRLEPSGGNPHASKPFRFWFNSSSKVAGTEAREAHMEEVKRLVDGAARRSGSPRRLKYRFLTSGSRIELDL